MKMQNQMTPWSNSLHNEVTKTVSSQLGEQSQPTPEAAPFHLHKSKQGAGGQLPDLHNQLFQNQHPYIFKVLSTDRCYTTFCLLFTFNSLHWRSRGYLHLTKMILLIVSLIQVSITFVNKKSHLKL